LQVGDVEEDDSTIKQSRSEEASNRVQEIYNEQGEAGAFDIIEQFKPITSRIVERRSEAPGFDRQLLTDEIETGQRGIIDLIKEYNPESGVPLAAYINKFLPARAIEASKKVLGEEFTEDVAEARGIAAEEVAEPTATKEVRGPRKPTETTRFSNTALNNLGVNNKAEAEKKISDAKKKDIEDKEVKRFGQTKNVPVAVAKIYGEMFGVNPETIYDKKRNYSKKDSEGLTRVKQHLIDNATSDFARLPKTKDDFGKATFIPNNVMNALYTDGKLTGTLKDYLNIIREKPVKPIYRDRVGQTIRGLFNTSIRNRMVEDLIPSKPERARAGVKFSLSTKQDLDWKITDEDIQTSFKVKGKEYTTRLEETAFMEFDEGQTYNDIDKIAKKLGIQEDSEGDDISSSEKFYHLEFADEAGDTGITGTGNATKVFSDNINGVVDYLKENPDVEGVVFTAKEPSRIRLYERLSEVMDDKNGRQLGYQNETFTVTNQRPKAKIKPKAVVKFSKQSLLDVTQARDIKAIAKLLGISKITVNDNNRVKKQKQMEEAIVAAKIPSWMFEGSKFGNFARRKVDGKYVDLPARGGLYYGTKDPAYQTALNLAKQNDADYNIKPPKRVNIKKAFTKIVDEDKFIQKLIDESAPLILKIKKHHDRPRPYELDKSLKAVKMDSMDTPSYPSGHSAQGILIGMALSDKYPSKKTKLMKIAKNISKSRNIAHAHYKSDSKFGEQIGKDMYNHIKNKL